MSAWRIGTGSRKSKAAEHLNRAIKAVYDNVGPSPVLVEIRAAMAELHMLEKSASGDEPDG